MWLIHCCINAAPCVELNIVMFGDCLVSFKLASVSTASSCTMITSMASQQYDNAIHVSIMQPGADDTLDLQKTGLYSLRKSKTIQGGCRCSGICKTTPLRHETE